MNDYNAVYRKHYPPALWDEVWRLERIGKDGAFHRKLSAENINTVQDFLKLCAVDPDRLRSVRVLNSLAERSNDVVMWTMCQNALCPC